MWRLSVQKRGGRRSSCESFAQPCRSGERYTDKTYAAEHLEREGTGGGVIELTTVVTLDGLNGEAELSGHPGKEVDKGGEGLRLGAQRKSPRVMRTIINHHQIVFITRNAKHRRGPQLTVNKIKACVTCEEEEKRSLT